MAIIKKPVEWLYFFSFWVTMWIADYVLRSVYNFKYGSPTHGWTAVCITIIFFLGYLFYLWRANLSEFLKRCFIAIPFVVTFTIFLKIIGVKNPIYLLYGLGVYNFLLFKTPSWKQHFSVVLSLVFILAIALKFSDAVLDKFIPQGIQPYQMWFPFICILFAAFFYGLYMRKVENDEAIVLRAIFIRILKFTAVFGLYWAAWVTLEIIVERYQISLPISLTVSGVLAAVFFAIVYLFDLMPVERKKKTNKKSKLGELQSELNDFCQEEREKSSGSQMHG